MGGAVYCQPSAHGTAYSSCRRPGVCGSHWFNAWTILETKLSFVLWRVTPFLEFPQERGAAEAPLWLGSGDAFGIFHVGIYIILDLDQSGDHYEGSTSCSVYISQLYIWELGK